MPAEGLARIPILVTGSWVKGGREVSFTREELSLAVDNFEKLANHDLNVDYDHACEDLERAGWRSHSRARGESWRWISRKNSREERGDRE